MVKTRPHSTDINYPTFMPGLMILIVIMTVLGLFIQLTMAADVANQDTLVISPHTISAKAMKAMEGRFGAIKDLLFLYPAAEKAGIIELGFPGELIVAPDKTKLSDLLAQNSSKIIINAEPDALSSIFQDDAPPAAKVMDEENHLVGIVATQETMEPFRAGAVVRAPGHHDAPKMETTLKGVDQAVEPQASHVTDSENSVAATHSPLEDEKNHATVDHDDVTDAPLPAEDSGHEASHTNETDDPPAKTVSDPAKPKETPPSESSAHSEPAHPPVAQKPHAEPDGHGASFDASLPHGVALINAITQPMNYELNKRFWGWRPNDLIGIGDNVRNFQLGVLEITRRTAIILSERVSRTGESAAFDPQLENAMNWFMIKPSRYWFPSAESKYQDALDALNGYKERLVKKQAKFFNRADNLIPLLMAYEDLLGSCEENLVKTKEEDGSPISFYKADDYIYYTKGVTSALLTILTAIEHDFADVIASRQAQGDIHHAITSCHHTVELDPVIVVNSNPSSIFANHRANQAAPLSHARFYLSVLIKTLST